MNNIIKLSISSIISMVITFGLTIDAYSLSATDWKAGNIASDDLFTDTRNMSVADIQNFLNIQTPTCDTNGTLPASEYGRPDLTHAQYAAIKGWSGPPYICLKDYYEVPKYEPGNFIPANNFSGSIPPGAVSAAQIIYDAAQQTGISPKVILVKLATESAGPLTSDTWPLQRQYTYAMGSHCPDSDPGGSANCDSNYAGFSMQVASGSSLLRYYLDNMTQSWWSFKKPYQTNSILWNVVETGCGAGDVYIESKATAALYTYTPYQPNQAALNNMYGLGDGCSAYGNRNFWRVWNDWFGPANTPILRTISTGKMYVRSSYGSLYYISNGDQLSDLGYGRGALNGYASISEDYVTSQGVSDLPTLIRFGDLPEVYYYANGTLHYVDYNTYLAYGSPAMGSLPVNLKAMYQIGEVASTVINNYKDGRLYQVENGERRYVLGPNAYSYYNIAQYSQSVTGPTLLSAIREGAPLAKPGTTLGATDSDVAGIVSEDGNHIYPFSRDFRKSFQRYLEPLPAAAIQKLPSISLPITNLVKDSVGSYYILDQTFKIKLSDTQKTTIGISDNTYSNAPDLLLNLLSNKSATGTFIPVRIGGQENIYLIQNKELLWVRSVGDLASYGYSNDNVITLTKNTIDTYFMNVSSEALPVGILARASNDSTVYLITKSGQKTRIPTAYRFNNVGLDFSWVRVVTPQSLSRILTTSDIAPYAYDPSGQAWLLHNGQRRLVPPAYMADYGLPVPQENTITPWHLYSLPRTFNASRFVRIDTRPEVYLVQGGSTHLLSYDAYISLSDNRWNDITPITQDLYDTLPQGAPQS